MMSQSRPQKRRKQVPNLAMVEEGETKDLFDDLPNSILEFILSMLTIKDAVNTSMISRRWRHLWLDPILTRRNLEINTTIFFGSTYIGPVRPTECFLYSHSEKQVFVRRVNAFLQLYQGNKVDSFKVTYFFNAESSTILDRWIRFAIRKGVEVLELRLFRVFPETISYYVFPNWLLSKFNSSTIKHLSLCRCILRSPVVDGFNLLRTLYLACVYIDEEFMSQLFTVCLLLESLTLNTCTVGSRLVVAGPSVLALNDFRVIDCGLLSNLEIHAVNLTSLECFGSKLRIVAIRAPRLDNVFFMAGGGDDDALHSNLTKFASSPRLETLYLHMFRELPQSIPTFRNLKQLNLDLLRYRYKTEDVDLEPVLNLLNGAPLLEELTLTVVGSRFYKNQLEMRDLSGFKHDNLRKVKMQGFQSNTYEIEFVICILKNATKLQQIIIDPFGKLYFGCASWMEVKSFGNENYNDSSWEERRRAVLKEKLKVHADARIIIL